MHLLLLGCVIKGETPHFDFISQATTDAIMKLSIHSKKPIGNGIITCLNMKQAKARKKKELKLLKLLYQFCHKNENIFSPKNNPRVIIIQKLYGKFFNKDEQIIFPKHRFKKFIKDIVSGTIERDELLIEELDKKLRKRFQFYKFR